MICDVVIQPSFAWSNNFFSLSVEISLGLVLFPNSEPLPEYINVQLQGGYSLLGLVLVFLECFFLSEKYHRENWKCKEKDCLLSSWKILGDTAPLQCLRIRSRESIFWVYHMSTTKLALKGGLGKEQWSFKKCSLPKKYVDQLGSGVNYSKGIKNLVDVGFVFSKGYKSYSFEFLFKLYFKIG